MVYLSDPDVRALREQAHAVSELTKHPGWAVYVDYIEHVMVGDKKRVLNDGNISSIEEYKKLVGRLEGMTRAINVPVEVAQLAATATELAAPDEEA